MCDMWYCLWNGSVFVIFGTVCGMAVFLYDMWYCLWKSSLCNIWY